MQLITINEIFFISSVFILSFYYSLQSYDFFSYLQEFSDKN